MKYEHIRVYLEEFDEVQDERWDEFVSTHYCSEGAVIVSHDRHKRIYGEEENGPHGCNIEEMCITAYDKIISHEELDFPEWQ